MKGLIDSGADIEQRSTSVARLKNSALRVLGTVTARSTIECAFLISQTATY